MSAERKVRSGFTLVEIMVVVAVLAVLAALAVPSYMSYRNTAHDKACLANKNMISSACTMALLKTGVVETDISKIAESMTDNPFRGDVKCPIGGEYTVRYSDDTGFSVTCSQDGQGHGEVK